MGELMTATQGKYSFLTTGPAYRFSMPDDFEALPSLSSPLENGRGGRSFDFVPTWRSNAEPEGCVLRDVLRDEADRRVELYWRLEAPAMWWLRWQLRSGLLVTHLREEDGEGMAAETVQALSIVEDAHDSVVALLPTAPLSLAVSSRPSYQERAVFVAPARDPQWHIAFQRPGFTAEGTFFALPEEDISDFVVFRAGLIDDVAVWLWGSRTERAAAESTMATIVDSFAPA
jgi:hypothetical protein